MAIIVSFLLATLSLSHAQQYRLQSAFTGPTFFDNFDFWTAGDPTFGYVHYVDRATAEQHGMINSTGNTATWGVDTTQILDPMANLGRLSVRLTSVQSWTHGLFILDLAHMPANECGVWPAWWMLGSGTWPANGTPTRMVCAAVWTTADSSDPGEIDIIETTNNLPNNLMALHTAETPDCTVAGADQSGTLLTANCAAAGGYTGCGVSATKPNNIGTPFNQASGGVYAMEWTSTAIRIWFFSRNEVPASIIEANDAGPDPNAFGVPVANFQGSCDIDAHFFNHSMVFDTTFCGSYAGNTWQGDGCPLIDPTNGWQSCDDFVATNPQAFVDAYWEVNHLKVYQTAAGPQITSSSSLSSVTPAIQTSSISTALSGAQGRSTTPSGTPSPVTTTPTSTPASFSGMSASSPSLTLTPSSVSYSSSVSMPVYATTVVVVITVGGKKISTLKPQIGSEQQQPMSAESQQLDRREHFVEASTTLRPEFPAYCEAHPSVCAVSLEKRDALMPLYDQDHAVHRTGRDRDHLTGALPLPSSKSEPATEQTSLTSATGELPAVVPVLGASDSGFLKPASIESGPSEQDVKQDARKSSSVLAGGSFNYCGVPGSFCVKPKPSHREAAEVTDLEHRHVDAPSLARPMVSLLLPYFPHRPTEPPPVAPYVGPDGIVYEPPKDNRDADKRAPKLTPNPHANLGPCFNPAALNTVFRLADAVTTPAPTFAQEKVQHTESAMTYLMEPAVIPSIGPNGIVAEPGLSGSSSDCKRNVEDSNVLGEVKVPQIASPMLYLMVPAWTLPPYTFETFVYDPETFAYDPETKRDAPPALPTSISRKLLHKEDVPFQPTVQAGVILKEGADQPSPMSSQDGHVASITCTPIVLLGQDGIPSATGCLPPLNIKITKSEPVIVADATRTATIPDGVGPQPTDLEWDFDGLIDDVALSAADLVSARTRTVVAALAALVALLV
ncbi:hypothetical protein LTR02_016854 [Friedmanniomyces endolithicus]|nr:hypothetical protein LTR94_021743 [Friedmanniomyces endolithicus]KAK0769356.1 hypothetical protein LTR59_017080 [Friedmanniomyces endolithicus]KAK0771726.1 hypothetical protein LTR38_017132 [Friedmanniomyces endolithicus]KAK0773552.1 hypothetical protein LTR75_017100 [Friedmanniomyces endolithicus]KAK0840616.1 hypothetical protein LTR03_010415 [Friedmanniomyces endolithicus]